VKVGVLIPRAGSTKAIGDELDRGFGLAVKINDGKLGGHPVNLVYADEGETAESGRAAFGQLVSQGVHVVTGVVNSAVMLAIRDLVEGLHIPLLGTNASPTSLQGVRYIWRTSYVNDQPGEALGRYLAQRLAGDRCYVIAANYGSGTDAVAGFKKTFPADQIVGDVLTPWPSTTDFLPYLGQIKSSTAKAVFCFYAGDAAVAFVRQYRQAGLTQDLYAPGFLTEGGVLAAQGEAAAGVYTAMNYASDLENSANVRFVGNYSREFNGALPTSYSVAAYDAALVLNRALQLVPTGQSLSGEEINLALGKVGQVASPRGGWLFNQGRTPQQTWYIRQVRSDGKLLNNNVLASIGTLG
jgi:branched-chain amino acid transport system substrate-binding protein